MFIYIYIYIYMYVDNSSPGLKFAGVLEHF